MPRTEEANQRIRDERKEQVLGAAAKVFARKGLADAKIVDIAAAAGISHGLAYRYFATKEEVFATIVERATAGAAGLAEAVSAQPGTTWDKLRWITEQILLGMRRRPEFSLVVLHALTNDAVPAEVREVALSQANTMYAVMLRLIGEGQALGQVASGDPKQLATLYFSCIQGLAIEVNFLVGSPLMLPDADMVLRIFKP
jgi:AcrR family transcriptional regulator